MNAVDVRFRLVRNDDRPATNPLHLEDTFGLQDNKQNIIEGTRRGDGAFVFDFSLTAKAGPDPDAPVFTGPFASGPVTDRFVYLAWRSVQTGQYINRVKARLAVIDWILVRDATANSRILNADMSGWTPGDSRKQVPWILA